MKHLKVEYNGLTLFDAEVEELQWADGPSGVTVNGKLPKPTPAPGAGVSGLLEKIVGASKQQTSNIITEKRADYEAEAE